MSPEQASQATRFRTDLFSFGHCPLRNGPRRLPFAAKPPRNVRFHSSQSTGPPVRLNPDLPSRLEEIINKALEKDSTYATSTHPICARFAASQARHRSAPASRVANGSVASSYGGALPAGVKTSTAIAAPSFSSVRASRNAFGASGNSSSPGGALESVSRLRRCKSARISDACW